MYNLLRSKGYTQDQNVDGVLNFLNSKGIHVDLNTRYDTSEETIKCVGYSASILFDSGTYIDPEEVFYTREDALWHAIYLIQDYF